MNENRIYSVTLAFEPPGPLHTSLLIAPDEGMAAALAMQSAMAVAPEHATLVGTTVFVVDAETLRRMLRAVEGNGAGDVVKLVPRGPSAATMFAEQAEQRAADALRQAPPDVTPVEDMPWVKPLDAADASTFTGLAATQAWEQYRAEHPEIYGPPMPGGAA